MTDTPDPPVWEDIRRAYETSAETIAEIVERFGITRYELNKQRTAEGWSTRQNGLEALALMRAKRALGVSTRIDPDAPPPPPRPPSAHSGGTPSHRRALIKRLFDVVDAKLAEIESRIVTGAKLTATAADREGRDIGTILKTFEKLQELTDARSSAPSKTSTQAATASTHDADDGEALRQDLVARLERIRQHASQSPAEGADAAPA